MAWWNRSKEEKTTVPDGPFKRAREKADQYAISHKAGTRVAAENKAGIWKEGQIIGEHDWALFTFFFTVKFDDGEICKLEERKVTRL